MIFFTLINISSQLHINYSTPFSKILHTCLFTIILHPSNISDFPLGRDSPTCLFTIILRPSNISYFPLGHDSRTCLFTIILHPSNISYFLLGRDSPTTKSHVTVVLFITQCKVPLTKCPVFTRRMLYTSYIFDQVRTCMLANTPLISSEVMELFPVWFNLRGFSGLPILRIFPMAIR